MNIAVRFDAPRDQLDGTGSSSPSGSLYSTAGSGVSARGNPIIMKSVTMMNHPIWAEAPSFQDMRRAYPSRAKEAEGFAVLHCQMERAGSLSRCDVSKETPERQGFAKAALSLAPLFRVSPDAMMKAPHGRQPIQVVVIRFAPSQTEAEQTVVLAETMKTTSGRPAPARCGGVWSVFRFGSTSRRSSRALNR